MILRAVSNCITRFPAIRNSAALQLQNAIIKRSGNDGKRRQLHQVVMMQNLLRHAPRPQQQNVVTRVNQLTTTPTKTRSYYSQYFQQDANSMIEQSQTYYTPREEFMLDFAAWFVAIAICAPCIITNSTSSGSAAATACFDDNLDFQNMDDLQNEALRREKEKEQEKQQQRDNNDNDHRNNDHNHVNKDDEENNK